MDIVVIFSSGLLLIYLKLFLDCKGIKPVNPKGDQPWIFFGRTGAEAEALILWPPDVKSRLIGKDPDSEIEWRQEKKKATEDEMFGWHQWLDGHECEWTPGVGFGQGGLACCDSRGRKESDMTEQLNWTEHKLTSNGFNLLTKILTSEIVNLLQS